MPMTAFLLQLSAWLPAPLRAYASEARIRLLVQFVMFGMVGLVGFVIDTGTVYALRQPVGLYVAGHRRLFHRGDRHMVLQPAVDLSSCRTASDPWHVQWRRFLAANLGGFVINRGVYALLVTFVAVAARQPVIAVFAGAMAGMTLNFNLSRKMVFR